MKTILLTLFIGLSFFSVAQQPVKNTLAPASEVKERVIKFYPNPASTVINFEFQKQADRGYTLQVYNFPGKKILEISNPSQKTTVPLTDFYRGLYLYQLRDKSGRIIESGKFQVAK